MATGKQSKLKNIVILIFSILIFLSGGFSAFEDAVFYLSKTETTCIITEIHKSESEKKPFNIRVSYFNKFKQAKVYSHILVDDQAGMNHYLNEMEVIYYGRFFENNIFLKSMTTPSFVQFFVEVFGCLLSAFSGYKSFKAL